MYPPVERYGRVGIFEDDDGFRANLNLLVSFCKHEVVIEGITLRQSLSDIELQARNLGHLGLEGVLLDGNLDGGDDNEDGRRIATAIRSLPGGREVYIVSIAGNGELVEGADVHYPKREFDEAVRDLDAHIKQKLGIA
jgi:hypothetical protein